jgi:hypothetical protein
MPNFGNSNADPLKPLIGLVDGLVEETVLVVGVSSISVILAVGAAEMASPGSATRKPIRAQFDSGPTAVLPSPEAPQPLGPLIYAINSSAAQHKLLRRTIEHDDPPPAKRPQVWIVAGKN